MPSMKTVKRRLNSVTTTKKIMKAMHMVAASKLQRDKNRLEAARPFYDGAKEIVDYIRGMEDVSDNIFLKQREVKSILYLVITSDRGFCGSYNSNVLNAALSHMENSGKNEKLILVGLKGNDFFRRKGKNIIRRYDDVIDTAFYEDAERVGRRLARLYARGDADEVYVAYTKFESILAHVPRIEKILPMGGGADGAGGASLMKYEPDLSSYLEQAVPVYLSAFVYAAMLESSACEQAARMVSMDAATDNASEIIEKLTLAYNRRRQASITQEISEIVGSSSIT